MNLRSIIDTAYYAMHNLCKGIVDTTVTSQAMFLDFFKKLRVVWVPKIQGKGLTSGKLQSFELFSAMYRVRIIALLILSDLIAFYSTTVRIIVKYL